WGIAYCVKGGRKKKHEAMKGFKDASYIPVFKELVTVENKGRGEKQIDNLLRA
ncbi:hypothetical protein E2562_005277, partial [Oryza meyeriana var. granulata]